MAGIAILSEEKRMFNFLKRKRDKIEQMPRDILAKIEDDFKDDKYQVIEIINGALNAAEYLRNDRIIRCILFLADKDIQKLKKSIEDGRSDPRDVMYWAEYVNRKSLDNSKRVRDFNKRFDQNDLTIKDE